MKGMNPLQFARVLSFVQGYHKFAFYPSDDVLRAIQFAYPKYPKYGYNIKYVDSCYDSRDGCIWNVTFRRGRDGITLSTNHYNALMPPPDDFPFNNLYDWCMAYLKGEWIPTKEFETYEHD